MLISEYKDRSRYLVHRVSARMETSFVGLTIEAQKGYTKKAIMEAPLELDITKFRRTAARSLRPWKAQRDEYHTKARSHDVQGSAPGQEYLGPARTRPRGVLRAWMRSGILFMAE